MCLSFNFPFSASWITFGTSFQSSQHTGDVVLLKLCNDFCTSNYTNPKFSRVTKGGEHSFTYNKVSLKVSYMCMICRVCALHTNRKHFLHLSEGGSDKYLRKIFSKFSRYFSLYHCQLNFTPYPVSDRVINTVCLSVVGCCQNKLNSAARF